MLLLDVYTVLDSFQQEGLKENSGTSVTTKLSPVRPHHTASLEK